MNVNGTVGGGIICKQCGIKTEWLFIDDSDEWYARNFDNNQKRECNLRCCGKAIFESELYVGSDDDDEYEIHNVFAAKNHSHDYSNIYAAKNHTHNYTTMNIKDNYITLSNETNSIEVYNKEAIDEMMLNINNGEAPVIDLSNYVSEAEVDTKMKTVKKELKESISKEYSEQIQSLESKVDSVLSSEDLINKLKSIDIDTINTISDLSILKKQIESLTNNINNILSSFKTMEENQRILFKLVDLYTEISNIKTSLSNIENRVISLENQKSTVDAIKEMLVSLDAAVKSNDAIVATYNDRISSLQVSSQTATSNITTLQQAIGTIQSNHGDILSFMNNVPSTYLTISAASDTYATQEDVNDIDERLSKAEENIIALETANEETNEGA